MEKKYHLFDAKGKILGRLATEVTGVLSGKGKVDFAPNVDAGDFAVVINSDDIKVSGNKEEAKKYHRYSGYPGGITSISLGDQRESDSRIIIEKAVYGMLPKNKLRKGMMKRLKIYSGNEHSHKIDIDHK